MKKQAGSTPGPQVCGQHARRHADATCQAQCFACGDCFAAMREALEMLTHEARHAVEFLDDLELSDNPACDPKNTQAAGFHGSRSGLQGAIVKARAALSLAARGGSKEE